MTNDRDKSIERLLRRADSVNGETTNHCLDAETLAALADDILTAAARREAESHVADCDRCQALSAVMVRAEVSAGPLVHEKAARTRMLGWLVPAAAAATAVALWVLVPDQRPAVPEQPVSDRQTAAATSPANPLQTAPAEQLGYSIREAPAQAPADARVGAEARGRDTAVGSGISPPASPGAPAAEQSLKAEESLERGARADSAAPRQEQTPAAAPQEQTQVAGGLQASGPASVPPAREASATSESRALDEAAARQNVEQGRAKESAQPLARAPDALSAQSRAAAIVEIVSPNPRVRWRVAAGSTVQRSTDGGASWTAQQIGVSAALTAGSAPSTEVCWLTGRGGIVLRTSDGGREWQRTPFPESADVTAITASTALDATVTLADGRRLSTLDGGRTWSPAR